MDLVCSRNCRQPLKANLVNIASGEEPEENEVTVGEKRESNVKKRKEKREPDFRRERKKRQSFELKRQPPKIMKFLKDL